MQLPFPISKFHFSPPSKSQLYFGNSKFFLRHFFFSASRLPPAPLHIRAGQPGAGGDRVQPRGLPPHPLLPGGQALPAVWRPRGGAAARGRPLRPEEGAGRGGRVLAQPAVPVRPGQGAAAVDGARRPLRPQAVPEPSLLAGGAVPVRRQAQQAGAGGQLQTAAHAGLSDR